MFALQDPSDIFGTLQIYFMGSIFRSKHRFSSVWTQFPLLSILKGFLSYSCITLQHLNLILFGSRLFFFVFKMFSSWYCLCLKRSFCDNTQVKTASISTRCWFWRITSFNNTKSRAFWANSVESTWQCHADFTTLPDLTV